MMKPSHALKAGIIVSIAVVILFVFSAAAPAMSSSQVNSFTSQANLPPNPELNSNVTWSEFYSGWSPLEYNNGTANLSLNAELNSAYANPISVNPSDMQSSLLQTNSPIQWFNLTSLSSITLGGSGAHNGFFIHNVNGQKALTIYGNGTAAGANAIIIAWKVPVKDLPSSNLQYDYIQLAGFTAGTTETGFYASAIPENNTHSGNNNVQPYQSANGTVKLGTMTGNQNFYEDMNLAQWAKLQDENYNTSANPTYYISTQLNFPTGATENTTLTVTSVSLTTNPTNPMTQLINGTQENPQAFLGNEIQINSLSSQVSVANNGYTVAVSQPLQNLTTQQNEISGNPKYVEQVTYQGNYLLPSAPDLSYSNSIISERLSINASQTTVLDINGLSLLSTISGKNGTVTLMTVNPNQKTTLIQIVDYTSSQWEEVSGPPGFFSVNGILYYFDEIVLGIIAVVGLAGGAAVARTRSLRRVK